MKMGQRHSAAGIGYPLKLDLKLSGQWGPLYGSGNTFELDMSERLLRVVCDNSNCFVTTNFVMTLRLEYTIRSVPATLNSNPSLHKTSRQNQGMNQPYIAQNGQLLLWVEMEPPNHRMHIAH
jgi:hypothetical protein